MNFGLIHVVLLTIHIKIWVVNDPSQLDPVSPTPSHCSQRRSSRVKRTSLGESTSGPPDGTAGVKLKKRETQQKPKHWVAGIDA